MPGFQPAAARDVTDPQPEPPPSLREFVYHAHHHRRPALLAGMTVLGLALLVAALLPPSFRAGATLAVLPSPEFTVRAAAGSHELNASALAMDQIMKAETEILGSDALHRATIAQMGPTRLYPDIFAPAPRNLVRRIIHAAAGVLLSPWRVAPNDETAARAERGDKRFRHDLTVLPAKDANVISVTFDAPDGITASGTLNAMLALYAVRRTSLYDDPQVDIVRREAEAGRSAVAAADERLAAFKRDHAITDYDSERDLLLRRRSQAEQAAQDTATSVSEHAARLDALTRQLAAERPTIGIYTEQDADTRLQSVNAGLEEIRAKLAAAREKYRESSRMVSGLRAELAAHEAEQARLNHDATLSVVRQGRNPAIDPLRLDRAREVGELAAARARLATEQQDTASLAGTLTALNADEAALAGLQRQRASADDTYRAASRILAERHMTEAEDASRLANVRVIQPAVPPQSPRATPLLVIAAGMLLGGLCACGWVVVAFMRRPVFLTSEGLQAATGLPVLAVFERVAVLA